MINLRTEFHSDGGLSPKKCKAKFDDMLSNAGIEADVGVYRKLPDRINDESYTNVMIGTPDSNGHLNLEIDILEKDLRKMLTESFPTAQMCMMHSEGQEGTLFVSINEPGLR